jgi:FkbM family methyltransferase
LKLGPGMQPTDSNNSMLVELGGRQYSVATERPKAAPWWSKAESGQWEEDTFRFLDATTKDGGATFVDVGAWIGPMALYASPRVQRVIALEPVPGVFKELSENVAANAVNIDAWNAAVDNASGTITLYHEAPGGKGSALTSSFGSSNPVEVRCVTFADIDAAIGPDKKVVLKVDIEGHEYRIIDDLVAFAKLRRAPTHLSLHPRFIWYDKRAQSGGLGARMAAYVETANAIRKLATVGRVSGGRWLAFSKVFLHRRPKNFDVELRQPY